MRRIEQFLIVAAGVMTGMLVFVSVCPSWQKTAASVGDSNDRPEAPVVKAISAPTAEPAASFVANSFCLVCHFDFDEEELALKHEVAGIGCERCHGESFRHRSDEANVTPPEILYPRERINPTCMMCHPRQDLRHLADHRPILEAALNLSEEKPTLNQDKKYCTACHGTKHRMNTRTIRWDKHTGVLLQEKN
ncbi:MAG: hypothetical protein FJ280_11855 [Planctomycetes bacterium]|nr:hypothetical protein [Planctomycetota bacterium]